MAAKKTDHELRIGALAHYDDPAYYARAYRGRTEDVVFYVEQAVTSGGPVLEYGCGAGRITIPMARAGVEVVGVDWSSPMLAALMSSKRLEPKTVAARISARRGDMRELALSQRFPLVVATFNVVLHLYDRDDFSRFLARAAKHLTPRGELLFDTSIPLASDLARDPSRAYTLRPFVHPTLGVRVGYKERFDYDPIRQILFVSMEFEPQARQGNGAGTKVAPFMTPLAHRQWFPAELADLLHYEGWEVVDRRGGFDGEPVSAESDVIVWRARPRRRAR